MDSVSICFVVYESSARYNKTIVWVENRENPNNDSSRVFKIRNYGNLVVLDGKGSILWSLNVSTASNSFVGEFLDTENVRIPNPTTLKPGKSR